MKKSTEKLMNVLPSKTLEHLDFKELNRTETTLTKLALFFENPKENSFDLQDLYLYLDNDKLDIALDAFHTFILEDSYLLPNHKKFMAVKSNDPFINQKSFADLLAENGFNFDKKKFSVYKSRGRMPTPDIEIEGLPYWYKSTALNYIRTNSNKYSYNAYTKGE